MTTIEWTDETWNPVTGCSKVSPGCAHCYAETLTMRHAKNWGVPGLPWTPENAEQNVQLRPERLDKPHKWRAPRMVFVNSMSDMFHELVPDEYIAKVFAVMALAPQHTFQILTKRPERMREFFTRRVEEGVGWLPGSYAAWLIAEEITGMTGLDRDADILPLRNVWLGTSIENHRFVDRAAHLRETPAAVRFISAEPLLASLHPATPDDEGEGTVQGLSLRGIDWLIVGGESGPHHRPIDPGWVRDLRDAALLAGTAFFFKQWGGRTPKAGGRELDGRTWNQMPETKVVA